MKEQGLERNKNEECIQQDSKRKEGVKEEKVKRKKRK